MLFELMDSWCSSLQGAGRLLLIYGGFWMLLVTPGGRWMLTDHAWGLLDIRHSFVEAARWVLAIPEGC